MRTITDSVLIAGFLLVDTLFFHDLFKVGEVTTVPQWVTGFLSLVVIFRSGRSLYTAALGSTEVVRAKEA